MPLQYLLDTNIVSYLLKEQMPAIHRHINKANPDSLATSSISEAEVFYGISKRPGSVRLQSAAENFFSVVTVLPWDSAAARTYGQLRADQERKGRTLSVEDLMIAAHALSLNLTLVTHDQAFSIVDGLKTEDWTIA
jgi:tRNA(fMet)-specific endonuclease VapC